MARAFSNNRSNADGLITYADFKMFYDNQSFYYDKNNAICFDDRSTEDGGSKIERDDGSEGAESHAPDMLKGNLSEIVMPVRKITELYELDSRNSGSKEEVSCASV